MPKIFIVAAPIEEGEYIGMALAEDGIGLASHWSSNKMWVRHDMGLTFSSSPKHKVYAAHYPDGYELVDLVDATDQELDTNKEYADAIEKNHMAALRDAATET